LRCPTNANKGGKANAIPGAIFFSCLALAGQGVANVANKRQSIEKVKREQPLWKDFVNSKWSPMKLLTNEEYATMLKEQLLRIEVEISLLDAKIEELKSQKKDT
jgi:hypothetical protein